MKIAFDHQIFSFQPYGGVSRYFFELASRLPNHGASDVSVVAPWHVNKYLADSGGSFTRGRYVNIPPLTIGGISLIPKANQLVAPWTWRGTNPDIVHETYFSLKPVGKGRRRVVTVYDMIHELLPAEFPDAKRMTAAKRAAVDRADHVICISENTQQDLVRIYDVNPEKTSVVHLGYSMTAGADATTTQEDRQKTAPFLLYVGNRRGYKNFSTLLQAYASSPVLREFELIAFGGPPLVPDEHEEIGALGITDRVRYESGSDQKLAARYRAAAAFVCPSKYEGFGLPPLEAMGHGCPVVCSNGGSIPEVVGDAGVYFDPNDHEELRAALERVATTDELQADLRARGYARTAVFPWDKCAAETAQIYREII